LVDVLREALARNKVEAAKEAGVKLKKGAILSETRALSRTSIISVMMH